MSVYSQYGSGVMNADLDIIANESYSGLTGAFRIIDESYENEHAIFEAIIGQDFAEAYNKINPSLVSESQLEAIQESGIKNIWNKVVEFIKTVSAKILGMIKNLRDKIQSIFIRDGKELVKKYGDQARKNARSDKLTKMKYKYAAPKTTYSNTKLEDKIDGSTLWGELKARIAVDAGTLLKSIPAPSDSAKYDSKTPIESEFFKPYTTDKKEEYLNNALTHTVGGSGTSTDAASYAKDFDTFLFEDVEEKENLTVDALNKCIDILQSSKNELKVIADNETATKKKIKLLNDAANKMLREMDTKSGKKDTDTEYFSRVDKKASIMASQVITLVSIYSNVATKYYSCLGVAFKKNLKQSRSIFIKAATYNAKKSVDEQVDLLTGIQESSDYEVDEMFDTVLS